MPSLSDQHVRESRIHCPIKALPFPNFLSFPYLQTLCMFRHWVNNDLIVSNALNIPASVFFLLAGRKGTHKCDHIIFLYQCSGWLKIYQHFIHLCCLVCDILRSHILLYFRRLLYLIFELLSSSRCLLSGSSTLVTTSIHKILLFLYCK